MKKYGKKVFLITLICFLVTIFLKVYVLAEGMKTLLQ